MQWKLLYLGAMKAQRSWRRLPPEQRQQLLDATKTTVRTKAPIVAQRAAETARTHGPVLAEKAGESAQKAAQTARVAAPIIARRFKEALERARKAE